VMLPFTGGMAHSSEVTRWVFDIAVNEINEAGGIKSLGGAKLKLIYKDHALSPNTSAALTESLIVKDQVDILVTAFFYDTSGPAAAVAERYRVPILACSTADIRMGQHGWKYMFMPFPPNADNWYSAPAFGMVEKMNKVSDVKAKTWAYIGENSMFGRDCMAKYPARIKAGGYESKLKELMPSNITDFGPIAKRLKDSGADVYFAVLHGAMNEMFIKAVAEQRATPVAIVIGGASTTSFRSLKESNSVMVTSPVPVRDIPVVRSLSEKLMARHAIDADDYAVSEYPNMYLIRDVLEMAGSIDKKAVRDAFAAIDVSGGVYDMLGFKRIKFDEKGINIFTGGGVLQIINKTFYLIWPDKEHDVIWPGEWEWAK